jgi:hypothetical protein
VDPKTGSPVEYDPRPRIVPVDLARGLYRLEWIGYDGETKSVGYERPDRLTAVVRADASYVIGGRYRYRYRVQVLEGSVQPLHHFGLQTFAADVVPVERRGVGFGRTNDLVSAFSRGTWFMFHVRRDGLSQEAPGRTVVFEIESEDPPGLVECLASGAQGGLNGVGEEPPAELFDALPGYEAWLRGWTIGPTADIASLADREKVARFRDWLPAFERAGWVTNAHRLRYADAARGADVAALRRLIELDFQNGMTTTEVLSIVRGLTQ